MTPKDANAIIPDVTLYKEPSYTWKIDYEKDSQIRSKCDGMKAIEQAIYKILQTQRYRYIIYSWNYGLDIEDLFGEPIPYVYAELARRITEALLVDDRIKEVIDFKFSDHGGDVHVAFKAVTEEGIIDIGKAVEGIV